MSASAPPSPAAAPPTSAAIERIPGSLTQAIRLARYQVRDYLRSRRFILMMSIVGVIGGILTFLVAYFRPAGLLASGNVFYGGLWASFAGIVVVFAGIIFGGDAIAGEFQNRTGYFLMGQPIRRSSVYVGKYLAALVASLVALLFYLAILVGNGAYYLGTAAMSLQLLESLGLAIVYLLALLGATFLFSSLFKTSVYAVLVVAVMFLFGFNLIDGIVQSVAGYEPWYSISYGARIIGYPLTGVPAHVSVGAFGGKAFNPTYVEGLAICLGYILFTSIAGLFLFEREEFT
jgi:ABC-2 type transport system permease protein